MFFSFVLKSRNIPFDGKDFSVLDIDLISSISLHEMYSFISYCQKDLGSSAGTRARKIVSIRQFWKYLKTMANLIDNNIAEVLETPKLPYRIPKHLNLDESVRLKGYINVKNMPILGAGVFVPYFMYFCTFGH